MLSPVKVEQGARFLKKAKKYHLFNRAVLNLICTVHQFCFAINAINIVLYLLDSINPIHQQIQKRAISRLDCLFFNKEFI
jgi:hypothetical protein